MKKQPPKIYVACLSAYASGKLHGQWIECNGDSDELWNGINRVITTSPEPDAEEWAVHDFEGWYGLTIDEYPEVEEICNWAKLIIEHGVAIAKFIDWAKEIGLEISANEFKSRYCGYFESSQKFAFESDEKEKFYQWKEFSKKYPVWANCIDWEHFANELELVYAYQYFQASESEGWGIYVFRYMPR